jgi:hypothetical protein
MRPEKQALATPGVIADSTDHVRGPHPGSRKQNDGINGIVGFHFFERGSSFLFAGDNNVMLNYLQTCRNECILGTLNQSVIDEWSPQWVFQAIFMNSENYESYCGLYHCSSYLLFESNWT